MFGKYKHTLDPKGRVFVPAKLREKLGTEFYIAKAPDACLTIYTEAEWQRLQDHFNELPPSKSRHMRVFLANVCKCEPDKQGRFLIPTTLRDYAGLKQDVTLIGQAGHAEIWDTESYDRLEAEMLTPENLAAGMEGLEL